MIHLDTSFLIRALVTGSAQDGILRNWLQAGEALAISTIGWTEFLCGPVKHQHIELAARIVPERVSFTDGHAVTAAGLFNESGRRRGSLADCMIAAVALDSSASLATANPVDFRRMSASGLILAAP